MTNDVIAVGPPPLTQQAADGAIDLIDFMAAAVTGVDSIDVTAEMRDRWRTYLCAYYPTLSPGERAWYAGADATLAKLQASWPALDAQVRETNRQNWSRTLPSVLRFADPVIHPGAAPAPSAPAPAASTRTSPGDLVAQIHQGQQEAEAKAFEEAGGGQAGLLAQQRIREQNQSINLQMLTEISKMRYESMMNVWKH